MGGLEWLWTLEVQVALAASPSIGNQARFTAGPFFCTAESYQNTAANSTGSLDRVVGYFRFGSLFAENAGLFGRFRQRLRCPLVRDARLSHRRDVEPFAGQQLADGDNLELRVLAPGRLVEPG